MGMYTEVFFRSQLRADVPEDVVNALLYLTGQITEENALAAYPLPDHPFFQKTRWRMVGCGSSAYFPRTENQVMQDTYDGTWSVFILANLKDYSNEIESFFDWVQPYCSETEGQFLGYELYEENDEPSIYVQTSPWRPLNLEQRKFWQDSVKPAT